MPILVGFLLGSRGATFSYEPHQQINRSKEQNKNTSSKSDGDQFNRWIILWNRGDPIWYLAYAQFVRAEKCWHCFVFVYSIIIICHVIHKIVYLRWQTILIFRCELFLWANKIRKTHVYLPKKKRANGCRRNESKWASKRVYVNIAIMKWTPQYVVA